jgi:hypothetical protein
LLLQINYLVNRTVEDGPNARSRFLQAIAHELADVDPVDDETAQRAVDTIMDAAPRR